MGSSLDRPVTEKESDWEEPGGNLWLAWGSSCMQGWRASMEDAHICKPALQMGGLWSDVAMFGVMDGHGGEQVAKFAQKHLPVELCAYEPRNGSLDFDDLKAGLTRAFHRIDERLREARALPELRALSNAATHQALASLGPMGASRNPNPDSVGCTCCIVCITYDDIVVANAGDSRAVLCRAGKAIALSEDHKPNDHGERSRIEAAGGWVVSQHAVGSKPCHRVNGNLNLSRALGDLEYKKDPTRGPEAQIISATPDVERFQRTAEDEFIVICCDGVWDMKENQEVVDFVRQRLPGQLKDPVDLARAMEELMDDCLSPDLRRTQGLGGDNMTAVIVWLKDTLYPPEDEPVAAGPPEDEPVVASSSSRARLTQVEIEHDTQRPLSDGDGDVANSSGHLVVWLQLPEGRRPDNVVEDYPAQDIQLWVKASTSELEVSALPGVVAPGATTARPEVDQTCFQLAAHLPDGAELKAVDRTALSAKLYMNPAELCVRLPFQMKKS